MSSPRPVHVAARTPRPAHVAAPTTAVIIQNSSPIPVVISGGPDAVGFWTLVVAILTLAVSVAAGVVALYALKYTKDSVSWAQKDFEISQTQAEKADAERAQGPELHLFCLNAQDDVVYVESDLSPTTFVFSLSLVNRGTRVATLMNVMLSTDKPMTFQTRTDDGHARTVVQSANDMLIELTRNALQPFLPSNVGEFTATATWGEHTLYWVARSAEGMWPVETAAPKEEWGQIKVVIRTALPPGFKYDDEGKPVKA
jgi:hypothetical protein